MHWNRLFICLLVITAFASCSDKEGQEKLQKRILSNARHYRDVNAASLAIQTLIALDSVKYASYKDTLMVIYATAGANAQAILIAKELLIERPKDTTVLKILANTTENLGLSVEAMKYFHSLFEVTGKPDFLYQVATIAFKEKRTDISEQMLNTIDSVPSSKDVFIVFSYEKGPRQKVPLDVAVLNLRGALAQDKGDVRAAQEYYQKALDKMPAFVQAYTNMQRLKQEKQKH